MRVGKLTIGKARISIALILLLVVPALARGAASPPNIFTYQGRLLDANGVPVTSASVSMIFELYTDPTAGSCVWSNSSATCASATARTVTLTDGLFSENLGDTTVGVDYAAIGDSIFADNAALYLRVTVGGEALSPRKQITASPYALNSETLDGYNTSLTGGSTASFVPVTSSSGNLTLTGDPSGSGVSAGVVYLNPTTASATETLLGLAVNGTQAFRVAGNGDIETTGSLVFEGSSDDLIETTFSITNPTGSDKTITFKNETGTVAYLSDLTGSSITLDTAYDAGGSGAGRTITADSGAVAISATSLSGDDLLAVAHTASGSITATTDTTSAFSSSRTLTAASTITDNYALMSLTRTSVANNAGAAYTANGSVLSLSNVATQTAGTLTDEVNVLSITQDGDSGGLALLVNSGSSAFNGFLMVGITSSSSEAITDAGFVVDDGDDFYVDDLLAVGDDVFIEDDLNVDGHATFGTEAASNFVTVGVGDSLACTSNCAAVGGAMVNTTNLFTTSVIGGSFSAESAVAQGGAGTMVGVLGASETSGTVSYDGTLVGVRGLVQRKSNTPTLTSAFGVLGDIVLDSMSNVSVRAAAVTGQLTLDTNQTITGTSNLLYGLLTQSNGTLSALNGLDLVISPTGGTITTPKGISVSVDPGSGTGSFGSASTTTGIEVTVDGDNPGGGIDVGTVYGANITATNSTNGTTTAYGVYATASGADTNYAGYFYGNLFQVDANGTPDLNNTLATGAGSIYATGDLEVDDDLLVNSHAAFGGNASVNDFAVVTATESIGCTSNCSLVRGVLTNTTAGFTSNATGGSFTVATAQSSGALGGLIGVSGAVTTTGTPTLDDDPVVGARGSFSVTSGSPVTIQDLRGVMGTLTLDDVGEIGNIATGVASLVDLAEATTSITGDVDLYLGGLTLTDGSLTTVNGLALGLDSAMTGGTITSLNGFDVNIALAGTAITNPRGGVITLAPGTGSFGGNTIGLTLDVSGNNPGLTTDRTVFGLEVDASTATDVGTPTAYGVYATASGGTTNYSGYFYGSLFQVDDNSTPDTNNALATGAGDIYAVGDIEADGDGRFDGGMITVRAASGDTELQSATGDLTGYAAVSISGTNAGGAYGDWQMYTTSQNATVVNGAASDIRWTTQGRYGLDFDLMRLTTAGNLITDGTMTPSSTADVAEAYLVEDPTITQGDILALTADGKLTRAFAGDGKQVLGVVSSKPGLILGTNDYGEVTADQRLVGLAGRVPTKVNLEGGPIAVGDAVTVSSVPGVGKKATGPGIIIGYAIEPYTGSGDRIEMFIQLGWDAAGKITADGTMVAVTDDLVVTGPDATALTPASDSSSLMLRGSAFDGVASDRAMTLQTAVSNTTDYRLSIRNTVDAEVAYVNQDGAFSIAGDMIVGDHLYPSDRGTPQTNRYIFYDGSAGPGGDFMRTNASGWATGSYDFAEMFPSRDTLEPGDVVVFGSEKEMVARSNEKSSGRLAGIVSTRPGFLAGDNASGSYPIALAGRVPTKVNNEGGEITIGDPLTPSSTPGVATKATEAGMIVGYALENFSGSSGTVVAFVNVTFWNGQSAQPKNTASGLLGTGISNLDVAGTLYVGANDILNVGSISGISKLWEITSEGNFRTRGTLATTVEAYNGDLVDTFATTSTQVTVTLSGSVELVEGTASVNLVEEDPQFLSVVANQVPLRIMATPNAPIAVYVTNRTAQGFDIVQVGGSSSGVVVDWYTIGTRKDFEPEEALVIETPGVPEEPEIEETDLTPKVEDEPIGGVPVPRQSEPEVELEVVQTEPELTSEPEPVPEPVLELEPEVVIEPTPEPVVEPVPEGGEVVEEVEAVEVVETVEVVEVDQPEPEMAPEPQQIPVESSHEDAGTASEGSGE